MFPRRSRGRPRHPDLLTPTEWQVLDHLRHGLRRNEIARLGGVSTDAVKYHLANLRGKLGVDNASLRRWPGIPATSPLTFRRTDPAMTHHPAPALGPIGQISLCVRDVERAERFYGEALGLRHLFTFGDLAFFDAAGIRLYLHRKDEAEWRPSSVVYFTVEDVHAAQDSLAGRGVRFGAAPHRIHTHEDGTEEWMSFFDDGEGNTLAIMAAVPPSSEPGQGAEASVR